MGGPYETEAEARENPAVQEIYAAFRADPGMGRMAPLINALLVDVCTMAGVDLGAFDRRVLSWLSGWEPETAAVICGMITRAHEAGRARSAMLGSAPARKTGQSSSRLLGHTTTYLATDCSLRRLISHVERHRS